MVAGHSRRLTRRRIELGLLVAIYACQGDIEGEPSGATCDVTSSLSYEIFGRDFMEKYCTRCHATDVAGKARHGAPEHANFDMYDGILDHAKLCDSLAAAGPSATNELMPPSKPMPTAEERRQLGAWLACGAPSVNESGSDGHAHDHKPE